MPPEAWQLFPLHMGMPPEAWQLFPLHMGMPTEAWQLLQHITSLLLSMPIPQQQNSKFNKFISLLGRIAGPA